MNSTDRGRLLFPAFVWVGIDFVQYSETAAKCVTVGDHQQQRERIQRQQRPRNSSSSTRRSPPTAPAVAGCGCFGRTCFTFIVVAALLLWERITQRQQTTRAQATPTGRATAPAHVHVLDLPYFGCLVYSTYFLVVLVYMVGLPHGVVFAFFCFFAYAQSPASTESQTGHICACCGCRCVYVTF